MNGRISFLDRRSDARTRPLADGVQHFLCPRKILLGDCDFLLIGKVGDKALGYVGQEVERLNVSPDRCRRQQLIGRTDP